MDTAGAVEPNVHSLAILSYFLAINESCGKVQPELKIWHSHIKKKPQSCFGAMPRGTVSPALFIAAQEFWIQRLSCHVYYYY